MAIALKRRNELRDDDVPAPADLPRSRYAATFDAACNLAAADSTAKPVDLWKPPIGNHTKAGQVMYEPFSGSGSQIIAAHVEGRICCAMELSPLYVDVAVRRWQSFTGEHATLESTGATFDESR